MSCVGVFPHVAGCFFFFVCVVILEEGSFVFLPQMIYDSDKTSKGFTRRVVVPL